MLFQAVTFGIGIYSFTFWVAPWSVEFGVGRSDVMTVYVTMQVCMGLFSPLAGRAMDRLSIRGLIIAGALCLALGLALAGRATALWHLNLIYGTLVVAGLVLAGPLAGQTLGGPLVQAGVGAWLWAWSPSAPPSVVSPCRCWSRPCIRSLAGAPPTTYWPCWWWSPSCL